MSKIMKRIDKNSLEEIIIQLTNFRGKDLIDIRIWTKPLPTEEKESKPTKKGVSFCQLRRKSQNQQKKVLVYQ